MLVRKAATSARRDAFSPCRPPQSSDIIQALQNHVKTEELQDLIAEVRPAEEPKAVKADEAKAEGSKGPSLPKKK